MDELLKIRALPKAAKKISIFFLKIVIFSLIVPVDLSFPAFSPAVDCIPCTPNDDERKQGEKDDDDGIDHAKEPGYPLIDGRNEIMTCLTTDRFGFLEVDRDGRDVDSAVKVFQPALKPVQFCLDPVDLLLDGYYILNFDRLFHDLIILGKLVLVRDFLCLEIDILLGYVLPLGRDRFDGADRFDPVRVFSNSAAGTGV